jgi:hypothetical protein
MLGSSLIFISQIKRDGSGVIDLKGSTMPQLSNIDFKMISLSITNKTYIACEFNSYVVKLK